MVAMRQRNTDILLDAFHNVSNPEHPQYGQYWSQQKIDALVAPPEVEVCDLLAYLGLYGVKCERRGGAALECTGFDLNCMNLRAPDLLEFVESHEGIMAPWDNPVCLNAPHSVGDGDGYVAREVMLELYNVTHAAVDNTGISVCAVEYQGAGGISESDLEKQQQLNGEPTKPLAKIVGGNGSPMLEAQLDVQMMSQVAENSDVWLWDSPKWVYSFAVNFLNATDIPDILSMSWGWSARDQCSSGLGPCPGNMTSAQYLHRTNLEYAKMGLRGVSIMVSSGDAGAPGRTNEGCSTGQGVADVNPAFPGSSPYVTSVSATYLVPEQPKSDNTWESPLCQQYGCVNGTKELPCNFAYTGWTTGGGFGIFDEKQTTWQADAVKAWVQSKALRPPNFKEGGRGYPDVSALGHYCPIVSGGQVMGVDGTSCSAPVFAALVALLNDHQVSQGKPKLGFINPILYKMWADNKKIFHDITQGNNWCTEMQCCNSTFGYEAAVGWDPVTGLGTPNFGLMLEWLDAQN
jgi:tripeptidyl-peptidase-1